MARYPTFEDYQAKGNYTEGIKRCNDFLKKNPKDIELLTTKLQLLHAAGQDPNPIIEQLVAIDPAVTDPRECLFITDAVQETQADIFPPPHSAGPQIAKLWDNAAKASPNTNRKLEILTLRFSKAVSSNRLVDAQQALIQLKALQPRNRVVYMAHAAVTQLLSEGKGDMQSRLALGLAKKAVSEKFDEDAALDCRVPGQILAVQGEALEGLGGRFKESKQVFEALRGAKNHGSKTAASGEGSSGLEKKAPAEWVSADFEGVKGEFAKLVASSASADAVLSFAVRAIKLFHKAFASLQNNRSRAAADACFVSISALVRTFELNGQTCHLLQAAYLAETLVRHNPHIHEARLILVYLYMRLNLGSLAMRLFHSLSIKELQHDTVGHALFTNLSLTHPHLTVWTRKEGLDPSKRTTSALNVYKRSEDQLAETEANILTHNQTGMLFDLQFLRDSLRLSTTRRIIHLEQRRLARLVHATSGESTLSIGPRVTANWTQTTDNRDFAATFNYGYNVEHALYSPAGSPPAKTQLLYGLAADAIWCLATGSPAPVQDLEKLLEELQTNPPDLSSLKLNQNTSSSHTWATSEHLAGDLACQVLLLQLNLRAKTGDTAADIASVRQKIDRLDLAALASRGDGLADTLRAHFLYLDVLRGAAKAGASASKLAAGHEAALLGVQDAALKACGVIYDRGRDEARGVKAADVRALIGRGESVEEALGLFEKGGLGEFCEAVTASAREGWEGLGRIRL